MLIRVNRWSDKQQFIQRMCEEEEDAEYDADGYGFWCYVVKTNLKVQYTLQVTTPESSDLSP